MRWRRRLRAALGPAQIEHERNLTADGLTKPGHVAAARDAGPGKVVVVIPAHDEETLIGEALESLAAQTRLADEVIVVADRCTDRTCEIAEAHRATVVETAGNLHQKAGAIDQVLDELLPRLSDNDAVLMMDADTSLSAASSPPRPCVFASPKGTVSASAQWVGSSSAAFRSRA
jgi:poly-beta-1,6-N-acetyl-D-glucosamine synthase